DPRGRSISEPRSVLETLARHPAVPPPGAQPCFPVLDRGARAPASFELSQVFVHGGRCWSRGARSSRLVYGFRFDFGVGANRLRINATSSAVSVRGVWRDIPSFPGAAFGEDT